MRFIKRVRQEASPLPPFERGKAEGLEGFGETSFSRAGFGMTIEKLQSSNFYYRIIPI